MSDIETHQDSEPTEVFDLDDLPYDEEDEDGDGDGSSGKGGGGKSPKRYRVIVEPFLEFADDPTLSPEENAERKLRLLATAPMSILVPGASSFASENDLSRKIFMVDIGQANGEATASDMADPNFVDKRDALQRQRRTLFGLPHPSLVLSGSIALASVMATAFAGFAASVAGKKPGEKISKKGKGAESKKAKLLDFSLDKESAFSAKDDPYKSYKIADEIGAHLGVLEHATIETVTEMVEVKRTALSFDSLSSYFDYLAEMAKAPVLKVDLKDGKGGAAEQSDAPISPWHEYSPIK
ncbi:MAG TPA: hypothetical protein PKI93_01475 [Alphaproteobacteria bacterium]|nr:hypothetical protein [Alphaproteobacteria bacterium]HNS44807.1 hypothetical protein [Alphaproteobacteria bacterium]